MNRKLLDYISRKFLLTFMFAFAGTVALFTKHMDGPTYVALATLLISAYSAANVADKKKKPNESADT